MAPKTLTTPTKASSGIGFRWWVKAVPCQDLPRSQQLGCGDNQPPSPWRGRLINTHCRHGLPAGVLTTAGVEPFS